MRIFGAVSRTQDYFLRDDSGAVIVLFDFRDVPGWAFCRIQWRMAARYFRRTYCARQFCRLFGRAITRYYGI